MQRDTGALRSPQEYSLFSDSPSKPLLVILSFLFSYATFKILREEKRNFFVTSHWDTLERNSGAENAKWDINSKTPQSQHWEFYLNFNSSKGRKHSSHIKYTHKIENFSTHSNLWLLNDVVGCCCMMYTIYISGFQMESGKWCANEL